MNIDQFLPTSTAHQQVGLGAPLATIKVYIGNRPNMPEYQMLASLKPVNIEQIQAIGSACGNGWRKVFNVYAKLLFELNSQCLVNHQEFADWQSLRDKQLLTENGNSALIFGLPCLMTSDSCGATTSGLQAVHIISGRTHAKTMLLATEFVWLNEEFAINRQHKIIICPYFDYRQLSNVKITYLVKLIESLLTDSSH